MTKQLLGLISIHSKAQHVSKVTDKPPWMYVNTIVQLGQGEIEDVERVSQTEL